ncbi:MAG: hypothetical protein GX591_02805 [Planctomycetes bacterium]|nr:hypothetical protein [Planctomycetota bacterium]
MTAADEGQLLGPMKADLLGDLTAEQRAELAARMGLVLDDGLDVNHAVRAILERQALILGFDREVLAELLAWGGCRVDEGATNFRMVAEICRIRSMRVGSLSDRALLTLARLRGAEVGRYPDRPQLLRALKRQESLRGKFDRKRRRLVGKLVAKLIGENPSKPPPQEGKRPLPGIREQIEELGLVGGLAGRIRGAADDYISAKLDEIEQRIDRKLDEIDLRLAEWRDREIANRLRILKFTLIASVIVAAISLIYAWLKTALGL